MFFFLVAPTLALRQFFQVTVETLVHNVFVMRRFRLVVCPLPVSNLWI